MGAISSSEMSNRQVIAIFLIGLALLLAAFWAGLSVIKDDANPTTRASGPQRPAVERQQEQRPEQASTAVAQTGVSGDGRKYIVVVAEFGTMAEARQLETQLEALNYISASVTTPEGQYPLYRVEVGPYNNKEDAEQTATELRNQGRKGIMIIPQK